MLGQPKKAAAFALVLAALAFGACGDNEGSVSGGGSGGSGSGSGSGSHAHEGEGAKTTLSTFLAAEAETTIDVNMKDFSFDMPTEIKSGKVLFKVKNSGSQEHEFVVYQGSKELIELHGVAAGKSGDLAVVLPAGRYTAKCLIGSGAARHDNLGMVQNFTVS